MVALSKRMSKRRCRSCPGRDGCLHVRIYDEKKNPPEKKEEDVEQKEGEKAVVEREKEEDEEENKTKLNLLFKQVFNYPPTEEDKVTNNRINTTQDLFPNGRMIPKGHLVEKCECGLLFSQIEMESNHPVIHHSRPTKDSRDHPLTIYFLKTEGCDHVKYYSGTEDGLIRTSLKVRKCDISVHFVSADLINEYCRILFGSSSSGKSLDSFVASKNSLNRSDRGSARPIPRHKAYDAFHVYLNGLKYDPEVGFGCPKCPKELGKGEKEDEFNQIEIHIW